MIMDFDRERLIAKIELQDKLYVGDTILIRKEAMQVVHKVERIMIEGINVDSAFFGDLVELELKEAVEQESSVYKIA